MTDKIDHEYTREIVCPYCGYKFTDSWDFGLTETPCEIECHNEDCLKKFSAYVDVDVTYVTNRVEKKDD